MDHSAVLGCSLNTFSEPVAVRLRHGQCGEENRPQCPDAGISAKPRTAATPEKEMRPFVVFFLDERKRKSLPTASFAGRHLTTQPRERVSRVSPLAGSGGSFVGTVHRRRPGNLLWNDEPHPRSRGCLATSDKAHCPAAPPFRTATFPHRTDGRSNPVVPGAFPGPLLTFLCCCLNSISVDERRSSKLLDKSRTP